MKKSLITILAFFSVLSLTKIEDVSAYHDDPPYAYKSGGTTKYSNYAYPLQGYDCPDIPKSKREEFIKKEGGAQKFGHNRIWWWIKASPNGLPDKKIVNEKKLVNNCMIVMGNPHGEDRTNPATGKKEYLHIGYTPHGDDFPNYAYPEWFAQSEITVNRNSYEWYPKPWTKPWANDEDVKSAPTGALTDVYKTHTPDFNDKRRLEMLSRVIDKYTGKAPGNFAKKNYKDKYFIKRNSDGSLDASELIKYAQINIEPTDYTAGSMTMFFKHRGSKSGSAAHGYLVGYSTFYLAPSKVPFEYNIKAGVEAPKETIYANEDFEITGKIINETSLPVMSHCTINSTKYLDCAGAKEKWHYKVVKGHDAKYSSAAVKEANFSNKLVEVGERKSENYQTIPHEEKENKKLKLDAGKYTVWVKVPFYDGESEKGKKDNYASVNITVESTDLELYSQDKFFDISPKAPQKSGTPINSIKVKVKNHAKRDYKDIEVHYYWKHYQTNKVMCTVVDNFQAGKEKIVTLGVEDGKKCEGINTSSKTEYPYWNITENNQEGTKVANAVLVVEVNPKPKKGQEEESYANNNKEFRVPVTGLNAYIEGIHLKAKNAPLNEKEGSVSVTPRITNLMSKPINAPCDTSGSNFEKCKGDGKPTKMTIKIKDRKTNQWIHTSTDTYSALDPGDTHYTSNKVFEKKLPAGKYTMRVEIPHYKYEYKYKDNAVEENFIIKDGTISTQKKIPDAVHTQCSPLKTSYITGAQPKYMSAGIAKYCVVQYPKFPSTHTEIGQGTYFKVKYRFVPSPVPPYNVITKDEYGLAQEFSLNDPTGSAGVSNSFLRYTDEPIEHPFFKGQKVPGVYKYRGRMFATKVDLEYWIIDPKGKILNNTIQKVHYDLGSGCYESNKLDYTKDESCRETEFFVPNKNPNLNQAIEKPTKEMKFHFKNPGTYTLYVKATENQFYRRQVNEPYYIPEQPYVPAVPSTPPDKDGKGGSPGRAAIPYRARIDVLNNWNTQVETKSPFPMQSGGFESPMKEGYLQSPSHFTSHQGIRDYFKKPYNIDSDNNDMYILKYQFNVSGLSSGNGN